jgi:hypothetical protein
MPMRLQQTAEGEKPLTGKRRMGNGGETTSNERSKSKGRGHLRHTFAHILHARQYSKF